MGGAKGRAEEESAVRGRLPQDFKREMQDILGGEFEQYLESFERPASRGLRVNVLKWSRQECMERLPCRTEPIPWIHNGLFYEGQERLSRDPYYFAGLYYLQEPSAMTPASLLCVEPGDMVLDLCAAPGGKSTELGARLGGRGMLVANDVSHSRAMALLQNLERFGIPNLCVVSEPPERLSRVFGGFFDKILVDAPCSGEGMFRRDRDMVKDWEEKGPGHYSGIQRGIAAEAVKMLKAGGYLLYSTCTFSRVENEGTVRWLLDEFPEMELVPLNRFEGASGGIGLDGCIRLFPHKIRGEGHFMALLRKSPKGHGGCPQSGQAQGAESGSPTESRRPKPCGPGASAGVWKDVGARDGLGERRKERGCGGGDSRDGRRKAQGHKGGDGGKRRAAGWEKGMEPGSQLAEFLGETGISWDVSRIAKKDEAVYYLPEGFVEDAGLRFLRTGLHMGTLKNGRFEPSQAMAMVLSEKLYSNCVSFAREDPRVVRYLKGETISLAEGETPVRGWCLVCVDGFALGFGKGGGMTVKNKYYVGWRWQ